MIKPPFFEIGPKSYLYGDDLVKLAQVADEVSGRYDVPIIFTPQYTDIRLLVKQTKNLLIFAQHMDWLPVGRGQGFVLPEAVRDAGAVGVMLNHAEKPLSLSDISKTIKRANEVGLISMVCASSIEEASAIAYLSPNIIVAEESELIGTKQISEQGYMEKAIFSIKKINPQIKVLIGAGVTCGNDVSRIIHAGADATGTTSGIIKAINPEEMIKEMIFSCRTAWDDKHNINV